MDLEDAVFTECIFRAVSLQGAPMARVTFGDCRIEEVNAPVLEAPDSGWWNTAVVGGRIGSAELYGSTFRSVKFERAKLGYLNLRRAKIKDVEFRDVHIEELDAGGANLERVTFIDCTIDTLALNGAKLKDVDLRGARLRTLSGISRAQGRHGELRAAHGPGPDPGQRIGPARRMSRVKRAQVDSGQGNAR